jgi:hypothetical protein
MLWSGMCFKCLGIHSVVNKAAYSNIVTYKFCMNGTVSNSKCERVSDIMMVVARYDNILD